MSRRATLVLGVGVLFALAGAALWWIRGPRAIGRRTSALIAARLARGELPADAPAHDRRTLARVRAFYARRGDRPAWTGGRGATTEARELLAVLERAAEEGL